MPRPLLAAIMLVALTLPAWAGERGEASYYGAGEKLNRITACGQMFSPWKIAAAHRTLPCGSRAQIINPANNRSIVVVINDRGPHRRTGRIIDVTVRVAELLGFVDQGVAEVLVVPLK